MNELHTNSGSLNSPQSVFLHCGKISGMANLKRKEDTFWLIVFELSVCGHLTSIKKNEENTERFLLYGIKKANR